jgi:hypothetical protein
MRHEECRLVLGRMVYIERLMVRLSTCCARFGINSDTQNARLAALLELERAA